MTGHKQTTDGTAYTIGYACNISGALMVDTYPSGLVVKAIRDSNGDEVVSPKRRAFLS